MTISVRLDRKTEALLERLAREASRTKSAVIRESIHVLAGEGERRKGAPRARPGSLYERMKPFIGVIKTDGSLLAGDWRGRWKQQIRRRNFSNDAD